MTMRAIGWIGWLLLGLCGSWAQDWAASYERALAAMRELDYRAAREAFLTAASQRPGDVSGPTNLPGAVTEPELWRGGKPYSPRFGAAYAGLKLALEMPEGEERDQLIDRVIEEFAALVADRQAGRATAFFLARALALVPGRERPAALAEGVRINPRWKEDTEFVSPEELALVAQMPDPPVAEEPAAPPRRAERKPPAGEAQPATPPATEGERVVTAPPRNPLDPDEPERPRRPAAPRRPAQPADRSVDILAGEPIPPGGPVPPVETKFALVIGNTENRLPELGIPYAAEDARRVRDGLIENAGYPEGNVVLLTDVTADEMRAAAEQLAQRLPDGATVFFYFTGVGVNVDGTDYLAGIDVEVASDTSKMVPKMEIFRAFMTKGASIFAFFQVHRPVRDGRVFGSEIPILGAISQMQATLPGTNVLSIFRGGREIGVFTNALVGVLQQFRQNQIEIIEFGWQVFSFMRRGGLGAGTDGLGSAQTPTLPVLTNLPSNARF